MNRSKQTLGNLAGMVASVSLLTPALRQLRRLRSDLRVFILEYHDVVADSEEGEGRVGISCFRRQLKYLTAHYRVVSLSEATLFLSASRPLSEDLVVLTFDDGYLNNYRYAWPATQAERVPATLFVTTDFLDGAELWFDVAQRGLEAQRAATQAPRNDGRKSLGDRVGWGPSIEQTIEHLKYARPDDRERFLNGLRAAGLEVSPPARPLTWEQLREMQAAGWDIGCHTASHPILSNLSRAQQEEEILKSRDRIAEETGTVPTLFAFPNGSSCDFNKETLELLRGHGFVAA